VRHHHTATLLAATGWTTARDAGIVVAALLWLASAFWVLKDARRRIAAPWLVGLATALGLFVPFLGPIVYLLVRPPEYLDDVRERELEIRAIEQRLAMRALECPVCRATVEATFIVCPICTTSLKQACSGCGAPLEAIWQACPYCATPVPPGALLRDASEQIRPRQRAVSD
jgi:hypothetical protein